MRSYKVTSTTAHYSGRGDALAGTIDDTHVVSDAADGVLVVNSTTGSVVGSFDDDAHYVWWATTMLGRTVERIGGPTPAPVAPAWTR